MHQYIISSFKPPYNPGNNNSSKDNNDGVKEKGGQHNVADIDDITCVICFINIEKDDY